VSLSSIRFITLDNTDLAKESIPLFFFLLRRNLFDGCGGGDNKSPSRPIPLELSPLVSNELSNDVERSFPDVYGNGEVLPSPPIIPSKNEF